MSSESATEAARDESWSALPPPRRPFRRTTLVVMAITALGAFFLIVGLSGELRYSTHTGAPADVGELSRLALDSAAANSWVRGEAALSTSNVVRYSRPLDPDSYRLARVEGSDRLWIEVRVPRDADGDRFVPPGSFVGRLVPARALGVRYGALADAVEETEKQALPGNAWLLIDGESPAGTRWVLPLVAVLAGFIAFNTAGLVRLLRPVRDDGA